MNDRPKLTNNYERLLVVLKILRRGCYHYHQLTALWEKSGMEPRKWLSNSSVVLAEIPKDHRAAEIDLDRNSLPPAKTLGVLWLALDDVFSFHVADQATDLRLTKRTILSKVATIFDQLGFLSPFIVRAKILLQEMWSKSLDWDDAIDAGIYTKAENWLNELTVLQHIRVSRCLQKSPEETTNTIHTFVDASKNAYGAVNYYTADYGDGRVDVTFIASKTRVCPLTPMTIPRLELLAAILGLRLMATITAVLGIPLSQARFWSDSMNVLYWIRREGRECRPFVEIGEIQSQTDPEQWQYANTKENPADMCPRGLGAVELTRSNFWWHGPGFLTKKELEWPRSKIEKGSDVSTEMKTTFISSREMF